MLQNKFKNRKMLNIRLKKWKNARKLVQKWKNFQKISSKIGKIYKNHSKIATKSKNSNFLMKNNWKNPNFTSKSPTKILPEALSRQFFVAIRCKFSTLLSFPSVNKTDVAQLVAASPANPVMPAPSSSTVFPFIIEGFFNK